MVRRIHLRRKWLLLAFMPLFLSACSTNESTTTVVSGNVRFQFLTPSLVRMEYSPTGQFVDAHTAVIKKRQWSAVKVRSETEGGWLTASTSALRLRYHTGTGAFNKHNLTVTWHDTTGFHTWHPGEVDSLNLGGMTYSLDNISSVNLLKTVDGRLLSPVHDTIPGIAFILPKAQPGLLSRSGYALINDSRTPVWNAKKDWIEPRKQTGDQDWYLFTYGLDYEKVLNEYAELSGHIPMIPRYALGPWITDMNFEYFPNTYQTEQPIFKKYNEQHLKNEVMKFRDNNIPLDILVLDFGWHNYGWQGGYDWSPLIPHPKQFLRWLHEQGLKVSLNDHPGYINTKMSILSYKDSQTPQVLKDLGRPIPPKPTFEMDVSRSWKFSVDRRDDGINQGWAEANFNDESWKTIDAGISWQYRGFKDYRGVAWYRKSVMFPSSLPDSLYFYVGDVNGSYRVYINGNEAHHTVVQWPRRLTYADISPYVKAGEKNEIAIRVDDKQPGGGITALPVSIVNVKPPPIIWFNLADKKQADVFMNDLHKPLMKEGVDFWWVDGGSGSVEMPGLNEQLWTNRVYYDYTRNETNKRGFIFSRYGGWGSQRYPAFFTGDTYSEWPVLAYEVTFTATGGNVLIPYITNDIGGFHGAKIPFDLYARWIEFGAFSPILRLHSAHENPYEGNVRMPWSYGEKGMSLVKKYFTLRTRLIPYIYTYTRIAYEKSIPILRPLYLEYPYLHAAYEHPHEYFFGKEMLVAPVTDSTGSRSIYLPPGKWIEFFSGRQYHGDTTFTAHYAVDEMPVFVRQGAIIPEQQDMPYSNARPLDTLTMNIYGSGKGSFDLYEDDGVSLKYENGQYAFTPMLYSTLSDGSHHIVIGPTNGSFDGQIQRRFYKVRVHSIMKPGSVSVNGHKMENWTWDNTGKTVTIDLHTESIRNKITVDLK